MNRNVFFLIIAIALCVGSCSNIDDTTTDEKIKKAFKEWSKVNLPTKAIVKSVSYDTVGCPVDFMFNSTMLNETVGSSGKADSEISKGFGLICGECVFDSSLLTTNIIIAKIKVNIKDSLCTFYIGMRGDSICTTPQEYGYEALIKTHHDGEQRLYDACYEIYCNLNEFYIEKCGSGRKLSEADYYNFWISLPSYEEAIRQSKYYSANNTI